MTTIGRRGVGFAAVLLAALALAPAAPAPAAQPAKESQVEMLTAGPVQCEFRDGQLRYLYVGDKEIVRRMYFAVRDDTWQTPMPVFSKVDVQKKADSFAVALAATCKSDKVDYAWTGEIVGTADGTITFSVTGTPAKTFKANRIGLCVLYGADSLVGQEFEAVSADGKATGGKWPELVSMDLVAKDYKTLRYKTAAGVGVECSLSPVLFSMEDQRNWGDSSFKSYNTILAGPEAKVGESATVAVTLKVTGAKLTPAAADNVVRVKVGEEIKGTKFPFIVWATGSKEAGDFLDLDKKRDQLKDQAEIQFGYKPSSHLPDDDTFMENRSALLGQLKTLRALAPKAKIRVDPIRLVDGDDPRSKGAFAASWMVGAMRYLTLGGADEVCFKMDGGKLAAHFSQENLVDARMLEVEVKAEGRSPVEAYALSPKSSARTLWLANSTDRPQHVRIAPVGLTANHIVTDFQGAKKPYKKDLDGGLDLDLGPYEACSVIYLLMPAL